MVPGADPRVYTEITDTTKMVSTVEEYLEDYNATAKTKMPLVMFVDAVGHVSRISRVIRQPQGNALLLGLGGSGRQSLTRLAASMAEMDVFQIEIAKNYGKGEWRDDLKKLLLAAGEEGKAVVFLFSDTQIVKESFVEDINNILNTGEVPNLFDSNDTDQILVSMRPLAQAAGLPLHKASSTPSSSSACARTSTSRSASRRWASPSARGCATSPFGQLLHDRLLRRVAGGGAAVGRLLRVGGRRFRSGRDEGGDRQHVRQDPPVGRGGARQVRGVAAALHLRDAHLVLGAARHVQAAAGGEARGGDDGEEAARDRARQARVDRGRGRQAEDAARGDAARADQDVEGGRGDDGAN